MVIMKEQARMTDNRSCGLWSRQRQWCSNYSANTAALCVYFVCVSVRVSVCVWVGGSTVVAIAPLAAVSPEPDDCRSKMCVGRHQGHPVHKKGAACKNCRRLEF